MLFLSMRPNLFLVQHEQHGIGTPQVCGFCKSNFLGICSCRFLPDLLGLHLTTHVDRGRCLVQHPVAIFLHN